MPKTCIVVPCYNEGNRINAPCFLDFLKNSPHSLCFVNDGSNDHTFEVVNTIKKNCPGKVAVVDLKENVGKAEAVRQGFFAVMKDQNCDFIGYLDADLATPPEEIDFLLSHFRKEIDIVIGSRVKRLGSNIKRYAFRHYLGRVFATMASITLDLEVYDSQCGAKIFRKEAAKKLFSRPFESKWLFDLEIIYRLKMAHRDDFNRVILEVPLRTWQEKGDTRIKFLDFITAPIELLKIKRNTLKPDPLEPLSRE